MLLFGGKSKNNVAIYLESLVRFIDLLVYFYSLYSEFVMLFFTIASHIYIVLVIIDCLILYSFLILHPRIIRRFHMNMSLKWMRALCMQHRPRSRTCAKLFSRWFLFETATDATCDHRLCKERLHAKLQILSFFVYEVLNRLVMFRWSYNSSFARENIFLLNESFKL